MPVTAKLSRRFYETFGDETTNELVNWFNDVDAEYRAELSRQNDLNFARFDARLGERLAEQDVRWEMRFSELDARVEKRLAEQDVKFGQRFSEVRAELHAFRAELKADIAGTRAEMVKWMFVFWSTTLAAVLLR